MPHMPVNQNAEQGEVFEIDTLKLLDCSKLHFERDASNFIKLTYEGNEYFNVRLTRLTPLYSKTTYISVAYDNDEMEFKEIGVIKDMRELSDEQYKLVNDYLEYKYFMPEITKIHSIKDNNRGFIFVDFETKSGRKTVCIRDWFSNFRLLTDCYLYANDVDGNKYYCPDINKLNKKSLQVLQLFI